jgi:F-type H+-transporting ATPase subunit a
MMALTLQEQGPNIGEVILHHTADAYTIDLYPLGEIHLPYFQQLKFSPAVDLNLTRHVVFLFVAAFLVFLTMWLAGRKLEAQRAGQNAPKGFANAVEGLVLFVRDEIAVANIGHGGEKFAPLIMTFFFFILYCNLLGLIPFGATPTGNMVVTAALAVIAFATIELTGMFTLGPKGYFHTIFPKVPGMEGAAGVAVSVFMAPIEIISKLVKPFALCVRLFGNMTAGHFVILALMGLIFLFGKLQGWNWAIGLVAAAMVLAIMLLELFVALLQAYVFALLTSVFIGMMRHEH